MKISLDVEKIRDVMGRILSVVDKKNNQQPILAYTLINANSGQLEFSVTDLEVSAKVIIDAEIKEAGSFCVNAKNLFDILRELPDEVIQLDMDEKGNTLKITCGDIYFTLLTCKGDNFPQLPFENKAHEFKLSSMQVLEIINKTSHAISHDETRLNLNGLYLQEIDSKLRAVATDGHRLSLIDIDFEMIEDKMNYLKKGIIIPRKGVLELKRIAESDTNGSITISVDDSFLYLNLNGTYYLNIRLIARGYPKYESVIPSKANYLMVTDRNTLFNAIKRIKIMSNEKSNSVRVKFNSGEITITANHPSLGDALETISVDYKGKEMEMGFNAKYLIDMLSTAPEGPVSLKLNNELSPVIIKSQDTPNSLNVIMPLNL